MDVSKKSEISPKRNDQGASLVINGSKQEVESPPGSIADNRQTRYLRLRWDWTEETIWTENMLTALENGVQGGKWFSLIDKVHRMTTLEKAWAKVKANNGAAGVDKVSIRRIADNPKKYLEELHTQLRTGSYRPNFVKRVFISKGDGKMRPLGIPTVLDRTAQMAVKLVIEPIFEKEFLPMSYGFRPGKGAKDALRQVQYALEDGKTWVVDADLQSYFDTIPHDKLMALVEERISDGNVLKLIRKWLEQGILDGTAVTIPEKGSPQGSVISPLLANLYLHDLDRLITTHGYEMIRYADDFVILCSSESEAKEALMKVQTWVEERGLILHPEKTQIGNCLIEGQGFDFLGYHFEAGSRWVRDKSIKKLRDSLRAKTRRCQGRSIAEVIDRVNPILRGWYNYFKHVNKWTMNTFDAFVRRRLRAILRKHEKRPGFGRSLRDHKQWPNSFFADLGLFSMEQARVSEIASRSSYG